MNRKIIENKKYLPLLLFEIRSSCILASNRFSCSTLFPGEFSSRCEKDTERKQINKKVIKIMSFWGRCVPMMESAGLSLKSRMALNLNHIDTQKTSFNHLVLLFTLGFKFLYLF